LQAPRRNGPSKRGNKLYEDKDADTKVKDAAESYKKTQLATIKTQPADKGEWQEKKKLSAKICA
jgi:hypothetical protein